MQFCDPATRDRLLAHLRTVSYEDPEPAITAPRPVHDEKWGMIAKADAGHIVRGNRISPKLIAWSPDGSRLFTSADGWGLTCWRFRKDSFSVEKEWTHSGRSGKGIPQRIFACSRFVVQQSEGGAFEYTDIYDLDLRCRVASFTGHVFHDHVPCASYNRNCGISPFRPHTASDFGHLPRSSQFQITDLAALPPKALSIGHLWNLLYTAIFDWRNLSHVTSRVFHRAVPKVEFDFSGLGLKDSSINGFQFHPSGQFVAINLGLLTPSQTVLLHIDSAAVIAAVEGAEGMAWSPGGRHLLLVKEG